MNQEDYIKERVVNQIDWYSKKSTWNKRMFYFFSIGSIILSSLIPVISLIPGEEVKYAMALIAAIISIFSGIVFICKFNDNWIAYRTTSETMKHELNLFQTNSGGYSSVRSFKYFVMQIEAMISKENSNWSKITDDDSEQ